VPDSCIGLGYADSRVALQHPHGRMDGAQIGVLSPYKAYPRVRMTSINLTGHYSVPSVIFGFPARISGDQKV